MPALASRRWLVRGAVLLGLLLAGIVGTVSDGPTGIASNSAWLIVRAAASAESETPSANNTGRCAGSTRERRPSRINHTLLS